MKVVFLNAWGDSMRDELVPYIQDQARDTDIFCLQEATPLVVERCASALENYAEIADNKFINEHDHFPLSIFVRKHIEVVSYGTLMQGAADRGLAIYIEVKVGDKRVVVCDVHGKSRPGDKLDDEGRIAQSEDIITAFAGKEVPVIVGGDFNILPDTHSIRMFEQNGYRDLIKDYGIDTTRNRLAWDRYPTKLYFSDYVFTRGDVTVEQFDVPKNEVSDHLPMILTLTL